MDSESGVFTITVLIDGAKVSTKYILTEVDIVHEVNKIPYAQLSYVDGNPNIREFELSNTNLFIPGNEIEILARYEGRRISDTTLFKGIIVKHAIEADTFSSSLMIEAKDKAVKMTASPKTAFFEDQDDESVIQSIIQENGLTAGSIEKLKIIHERLVQYNTSDWDFINQRADTNGRWVVVEDGKFKIVDPVNLSRESSDWSLDYGFSAIKNVHLEIDAESQIKAVEGVSYDAKEIKLTKESLANKVSLNAGNLKPDQLAGKLGNDTFYINSGVSLINEELKSWVNAKMLKSRLAMYRGSFTMAGNPKAKVLDIVKVDGVSKRFNGKSIVTGVRHRISDERWLTDIQLGLKSEWYAEKHNTNTLLGGGLLPAIHGLHIGIVTKFEEDPLGEYRAKINIPSFGNKDLSVWARMASPDAGSNRGYIFRPEEGDEVVVGFLNNDPREAIVLGALFSSKNTPPVELDADNFIKGIFSKQGLTLKFDDEKKSIELITPQQQSILLEDDTPTIQIQDANENKIIMDKKGITIVSASKISIEADDDINISSGNNISIEAKSNVTIKGSQVDVK